MARAAAKGAEQLVLHALEAALSAGGEVRLVKLGSKPENAGLFKDDKGTAKAAIEQCLGDPPLLRVVRTEAVKTGRTTKQHRFVTITPEGIAFLAAHLPPSAAARLLKNSLQKTSDELNGVEEGLGRLRQARNNLEGLLGAYLRQLESADCQMEAQVEELRGRSGQLQEQLDGLPIGGWSAGLSESETDFVRRLVHHMVYAYQDIDPEARPPIEQALFNAGVERIGKTGEHTKFVGRLHECDESVFPDDPVEILQPGWFMKDKQGEYLLAKAKVKALSQPLEPSANASPGEPEPLAP